MADYRTITNYALRESGITQDDLTTSNFASPPDPILTRFKQWVAAAYEDIQTDKLDWEFMQASGVTLCLPKMEVYGCYSSTTPEAGDFTGVEFKVHNGTNPTVFTGGTLSGTDATVSLITAGKGEGELTFSNLVPAQASVVFDPGDFITNADSSISCYFRRWGRYSLIQDEALGKDTTLDIAEIKLSSLGVSAQEAGTGDDYTATTYEKLRVIPYSKWQNYGYDCPVAMGKPTKVTMSNDGRVQFYPPLDAPYNISFEYTRTPQTLSLHGDTPTYLPSRFHNAIAWRAVMYWAEYEGNSQQYNRAKSRYDKFEADMARDLLPPEQVLSDGRVW